MGQGENANPARLVQIDFTLGVGKGRVDASVQVPAGRVTLTQIVPAIQELASNVVGSVVQIVESEGHRISCRAGCGACCRQIVPLSLFEAEALSEWIRTLPPEQQQELERRFREALLKLRDAGVLEKLDPELWVEGDEATQKLALDYLHAGVPCPFLEQESCSIHPIRPVICREYLVTSPPEFCASPTAETVRVVPMPLKASQGLFRLGAEVEQGGRGWIPLVFLKAWMQYSLRPGDAITGSGPEVLRRFVEQLLTGSREGELPASST